MSQELAAPQFGRVHQFGNNLTAFEFETDPVKTSPNVVLFVAGLTNGLLDVPYLVPLSKKVSSIESRHGKWVLIQAILSSAYLGWGTSSLKQDAEEISKLVKYLRSEVGGKRQKIVLAGHSTGCQDTMQYMTKKSYEENFDEQLRIDGGILQAPVSDSEAFGKDLDENDRGFIEDIHRDYISQGKENHILPEKYRKYTFGYPITAYRLYSLASRRGDDDYFSSYLNGDDYELSFGKVKRPLLVLYGSKDEFTPDYVDREMLVTQWQKSTDPKYWSPLSKVLKGATHNVGAGSDEGTIDDLINTVAKFLVSL